MLITSLLQVVEDGRVARSYIIKTYDGRIASITDCSGVMASDSEGAWLSGFIGKHMIELTPLLKDKVLLDIDNYDGNNYVNVLRGKSVGINHGARTWTKNRFKEYYSLFRKYRDKILSKAALSSEDEDEIFGLLIEDNLASDGSWDTTELFNFLNEYYEESPNIVGPHVLAWRKQLRESGRKASIRYKDGKRRVYIHPRGTYVNLDGEVVLSRRRRH